MDDASSFANPADDMPRREPREAPVRHHAQDARATPSPHQVRRRCATLQPDSWAGPRVPLDCGAQLRFAYAVSSNCTLSIKAVPNAPRTEFAGWMGEVAKIKVHAPPVEGKANEELRAFLAETLDVPRRAVTVLRGDTARHKVIRIDGRSLAEARARLQAPGR